MHLFITFSLSDLELMLANVYTCFIYQLLQFILLHISQCFDLFGDLFCLKEKV